MMANKLSGLGSSPPVRGALVWVRSPILLIGIIPACAGSTLEAAVPHMAYSDHPRLRGEHAGMPERMTPAEGSSPPARGALNRQTLLGAHFGIIPACAGSTPPPSQPNGFCRDHPPPARGALEHHAVLSAADGIIPACAGITM